MAEAPFAIKWSPAPEKFLRAAGVRAGAALTHHLGVELENIGRSFETKFRFKRLRGTGSNSLANRTGALSEALGHKAVTHGGLDNLLVHVGFGPPAHPWAGGAARYAPVHEGLVPMPIRPKRGKFLAIPVSRTKGGDVRGVTSPLQLGNAQFVPYNFKTGPGFLVFDSGTLRFLLVRSVTIPKRLNFAKDWKAFEPEAIARLDAALDRAIAEANA